MKAESINIRPYPLFAPPNHLSPSNRRQWTRADAEEYLGWLVDSAPSRITALKSVVQYPGHMSSTDELNWLGERVARLLRSEPFSSKTDNGFRITEQGRALAADMGLLVAHRLLSEHKGLMWAVLERPKSDLSFNLPVIVGFQTGHLDPIVGSIGEAAAILRGERKGDAWTRVFNFWSSRASSQ